jgi:transposase-like protein
VILSNEVECDEAYVTAGHKGQPEVVKSKERQGRRRRLQGKAGRGTLEKERPPVFGMLQRGGQVVITLLANVKQKTIEPLIKDTIVPRTRVYTDEYSIYARVQSWGYGHKHVNHGRGEFARDDDGDGVCEVHVNTMEGFWSLLRSWLRPIGVFPKRNSRSTWDSSSSCTTSASEAKRCCLRSLSSWSRKTLESNKSVSKYPPWLRCMKQL